LVSKGKYKKVFRISVPFLRRKSIVDSLSWLGVDIHSHLLPGIDDGSPDLETSIRLIKGIHELGFTKLICTPHIYTELYPNSMSTINPALKRVREELKHRSVPVAIAAAAEYMINETFEVSKSLMCLQDRYILVEMSFLAEYPAIEEIIQELQRAGYFVVLAHPERYLYYHLNEQQLRKFKDMGVLLQLNLLSVLGYYGKSVEAAAKHLLKSKLYDLAGSDIHHDRQLQTLARSVRSGKLYRLIGNYDFKNRTLFSSQQKPLEVLDLHSK
jgi:protein-tyrosine phosphatase